ncbi:hypothetical protein PWT90_07876 [Aphanocladium album]|nr:hypothetical protein PWT90_07876 [Aphanocladium album]
MTIKLATLKGSNPTLFLSNTDDTPTMHRFDRNMDDMNTHRRKPRNFKMIGFFVILIAGLVGLIIYQSDNIKDMADKVTVYMRNLSQQPTMHMQEACAQPQTATTVRYFDEISALEDLSPSGDSAWTSMVNTPKGGFIWVKHNATVDMAWGVSMFHAIHCLQLLRGTIQMQTYNVTAKAHDHGGGGAPKQNEGHEAFDMGHVGHCFGYLAQQILCNGDDTIEPPWFVRDDDGNILDAGVNGVGFKHQCRDTRAVWDKVMDTEKKSIPLWDWQMGDTISSVFGGQQHAHFHG